MAGDRDYVLGAHRAELERLGLQHAVWRPYALAAWRRAGFTRGQILLDIGAGPGYATRDLADVVGDAGKVIALERAPAFLAALEEGKRANIEIRDTDLAEAPTLPSADGAWCRWVFAFLREPEALLPRIAAALEPGAPLVIHEYADYAAWRCFPGDEINVFAEAVKTSWRATGGEPDIAPALVQALPRCGFKIREIKPIVDVVRPTDFAANWPLSFIDVNTKRLAELGFLTEAQAQATRDAALAWIKAPDALMILPIVLEIIAERA
ncbi:MAG: methyltransferase domain-containing protein [Pseudomonadota bacterium]